MEENEIDPLFCKAYGVQYNPDRGREVFLSSAKAEELDNEYSQYLDDRQPSPSKTNGDKGDDTSSRQPDVLRKAKLKADTQDSSFDSEDQAERAKAMKAQETLRRKKGKTGDSKDGKDALLQRRDDLRIKTIAKFKAVRDGDLDMYDEIENQMLDMAAVKGKAFDDSEIIEDELEILEDLSDRGMNNPEANFGR